MHFINPAHLWRMQKDLYQLRGNQCDSCKKMHVGQMYLCACGNQTFTHIALSGNGILENFTQVNTPPSAYSGQHPYCIGLVRLEEGPLIMGQLTDVVFEQLSIGIPVKSCLRRYFTDGDDGLICYGLKFVPHWVYQF